MFNEKFVRMNLRTYNTILLHAITYASSKIPQKEWKIVYGFLCGTIQDKTIVIYEAIPMTHGNYYSVEFKFGDYVNSGRVDAEIAEKEYFLMGWYHSHPGKGLFLHEVDIINQLGYQRFNPDAIALVVDPKQLGPDSSRIEVFSLDNVELDTLPGYHTVKWEIDQKLDEVKIDGPILRELKEKELVKDS